MKRTLEGPLLLRSCKVMAVGIVCFEGGIYLAICGRETRTEEPRLFNRLSMKDESLCWFKGSLKIIWQETDTS